MGEKGTEQRAPYKLCWGAGRAGWTPGCTAWLPSATLPGTPTVFSLLFSLLSELLNYDCDQNGETLKPAVQNLEKRGIGELLPECHAATLRSTASACGHSLD